MRIVMFYHSVLSDWNHGNAHFLRGIATELCSRGHEVRVYEQSDAWSVLNLLQERGEEPIAQFHAHYPDINVFRYDPQTIDLDQALDRADLVLVHEWNDPVLVAKIGRHHRQTGNYSLFFHDTHHRSVTAPDSMRQYDLRDYDGVLAYGASIRDVYLRNKWCSNVWVWHEAADTRIFHPLSRGGSALDGNGHVCSSRQHNENGFRDSEQGDVVWIGNWGDEERAAEIQEFLIIPVKELGLKGTYANLFPVIQSISGNQGGGPNMGPGAQTNLVNTKPTANASATWVKNNHTVKLGAEVRYVTDAHRANFRQLRNLMHSRPVSA